MKTIKKTLVFSIIFAALLACSVFNVKPSAWDGIPIMPNATEGSNFPSHTYSFTVKATTNEAQSFYETELVKLGWKEIEVDKSETAQSLTLIFAKDSSTLSCVIFDHQDGTLKIMLVK